MIQLPHVRHFLDLKACCIAGHAILFALSIATSKRYAPVRLLMDTYSYSAFKSKLSNCSAVVVAERSGMALKRCFWYGHASVHHLTCCCVCRLVKAAPLARKAQQASSQSAARTQAHLQRRLLQARPPKTLLAALPLLSPSQRHQLLTQATVPALRPQTCLPGQTLLLHSQYQQFYQQHLSGAVQQPQQL